MKRALCITITCFILCAALCGCQPTPQKEIVVGKDIDVYLEPQEQPNSAERAQLSFPQKHNESIDVGNPNVTLNIDAEVIAPALTAYPVYSAEPVFISQETVDSAVSAFIGDKIMYDTLYVTDLTQAEVLERLAYFKQLTAADNSFEYGHEMIAFYQEKLKTAPVTIERTVNNGQFGENFAAPTQDPDSPPVPMLLPPGNDYNNINANADMGKETFAAFSAHRFTNNEKYSYIRFTNTGNLYLSGVYKYNPGNIAGLALTQKQAVSQAQNILSQLGINDMELAYSLSDMAVNAVASEQDHECYVLIFTKRMNGLQAAYHTPMLCIGVASETDMYREPFPPEYIIMAFDDTGLLSFGWEALTSITLANEGAALLSFDEMMEHYRRHCKASLSWIDESISSLDITITEIRLCMAKIAASADEYLYVPAWSFIGVDQQTSSDSGQSIVHDNAAQSYFIVNAIDGSLIQ